MARYLIGMTGASGSIYGVDLLKRLPGEKYLVMSDWARQVMATELGLKPSDLAPHVKKVFADTDLAAPFSSGSNRHDALIITPCSVSTLGKIAAGIADTLITRAAAVALKERMRMVLCVRETPLSTIALREPVPALARGRDRHADLAAVVRQPQGPRPAGGWVHLQGARAAGRGRRSRLARRGARVIDWRSRVALGAVLAVVAGIVVMLLYGLYAGRLLHWRRAVSARQSEQRRATQRERALADSLAEADAARAGSAP